MASNLVLPTQTEEDPLVKAMREQMEKDAQQNTQSMSASSNQADLDRFAQGVAKVTGPFGTVLNVINRPFSAVFGALDAVDEAVMASPLAAPLRAESVNTDRGTFDLPKKITSNIFDALVKGKPFGTSTMIERRDIPGFDVSEPLRDLAAIAGDVATGWYLDPIGKLKLLGEVDDGVRVLASVNGSSVLPKGVDVALSSLAAKGKGALNSVPGYRTAVDFMSDMYKTQRQTEDKYGEFFNWLKETAYDLDKGLTEKQEALTAIRDNFSDKDLPKNLFDFAYSVLENPNVINDGATITRVVAAKSDDALQSFTKTLVSNRVAEIDTALDDMNNGLFFRPKGSPQAAQAPIDDLVSKFDKSVTDDILASAARQEEIETKLRARLWDTAKKKSEGVQGIDTELRYLEKQNAALEAMRPVPGDEPVQYIQNALRLRLLEERNALTDVFKGGNTTKIANTANTLLERAGVKNFFDTEEVLAVDVFGRDVMQSDDAKELISTLVPWQKYAQSMYDEAHQIAGADPPDLPFENYMKHIRADKAVALFPKSWSASKRQSDMASDFKRSFVADGVDPSIAESLAETAVKKMMQQDKKPSKLSALERRGVFEPMLGRKIDLDAVEINASDAISYKVNTNVIDTMNRMVQDAERFKFATSVYSEAVKRSGIDKAAYDALTDVAKKQYAEVPFRLKFIPDKSVDPFEGKFIPKDMLEAINDNLGVHREITGHRGTGLVLNFLESLRRSYSMSTLAVFPARYTRDFMGSYLNASLGGTNLGTDTGRLAYGTALNVFGKKFDTKGVGQVIDTGLMRDDTLKAINELFPGVDMTPDKLRKMLYVADLTGHAQFRDIGMARAAQATIGKPASQHADIFRQFADDLLKDINPRNQLDMNRSAVARGVNPVNYFMPSRFEGNPVYNFFMSEVARPVEDVPRAATYIDHLLRNGQKGMTFEQANDRAIRATRHYLGDPTSKNLTHAERDIVPLFAPFYKWSRHNLPLQFQTLVQEPGKYGSLARAYRGQYDRYEDDIDPKNTATFISDNFGVPVKKVENPDGTSTVYYGLLGGWIPAGDLGQMAAILNPEDGSGIARGAFDYTLSQTNGWMRTAVEQAFDYDTRLRDKISEGKTKEMFGLAVDPNTAHTLRSIRFLNEVDRLNPGNIFTHIGNFFGTFEGDRPNRNEVEQSNRVIRTLFGLSSFENDEEKILKSEYYKIQDELQLLRTKGRNAIKENFTSGLQEAKDEVDPLKKKMDDWSKRWRELKERQNRQRQESAIRKSAQEQSE